MWEGDSVRLATKEARLKGSRPTSFISLIAGVTASLSTPRPCLTAFAVCEVPDSRKPGSPPMLMKDVLIFIQDTGMRPEEVVRIRIENINWSQRLMFNPHGKTRAARRHVPISERMLELLMVRCSDKREGWLFPSRRAKGGHLTTVAKQFREARSKAGLPASLVLYCARHTFGTAAYGATGNLAMVMKVMGQTDVRTAMRYQHPVLHPVRDAIDQRNLRQKPRHNELRVR
jgi:integrase